MQSCYGILHIGKTATIEEIVAACDDAYNRWRGLVNHQDPAVAAGAAKELRSIEAIRTTLTDPTKRAAYDDALDFGGLADPEALLRQAPTPLARRSAAGFATANEKGRPNPWGCPECQADNPPQTAHCYSCGAELLRECPECHKVSSLVSTGYCGTCGLRYDLASRRVELKQEIGAITQELLALESEAVEARATIHVSSGQHLYTGNHLAALVALSPAVGIMLVIYGLGNTVFGQADIWSAGAFLVGVACTVWGWRSIIGQEAAEKRAKEEIMVAFEARRRTMDMQRQVLQDEYDSLAPTRKV